MTQEERIAELEAEVKTILTLLEECRRKLNRHERRLDRHSKLLSKESA